MKKMIFCLFVIVFALILKNCYYGQYNNKVDLSFSKQIEIKKPRRKIRVFETPNAFQEADAFYIFDYEQSDSDDIIKQLEHDDLKHLENQILVCKRNYNSEYYHLFEENFPKEINENLYYKIKSTKRNNLVLVYDASSYKLYYIFCYFK